jgi:FtsZ-binding cell division protein ZapB
MQIPPMNSGYHLWPVATEEIVPRLIAAFYSTSKGAQGAVDSNELTAWKEFASVRHYIRSEDASKADDAFNDLHSLFYIMIDKSKEYYNNAVLAEVQEPDSEFVKQLEKQLQKPRSAWAETLKANLPKLGMRYSRFPDQILNSLR